MTDKGQRHSVHRCISNYPYNAGSGSAQANLEASCKNSLDFVQRLNLLSTLSVHNGCVNTVNWNASGTLIVSGSDDNHLVITETKSGRVAARTKTQHKRHIFSARFMPHSNDLAVISCSGEGIVLHTEFLAPYGPGRSMEEALIGEPDRYASFFDCHAFGSTYDVLPLPDSPRMFLSCGEDGTVRCIDLRVSSRCAESVCDKHIFITAPCAVTAMDVAPINHYNVAIGCSDSIVRLYDRRMLSAGIDRERITWPLKAYPIPMKYTRRHYRPTCVKFSADESELLVSYSMEQLYLFDMHHPGYNDAELLRSGCYTPKLRRDNDPEPQMPRLRFRGDWSDTGPNSMASAEHGSNRPNVGQARPPLEPGVLSRLSDEIFRMLNSQTRQLRALNPSTSTSYSTPRTPAHMSWQDAVLRTLDNQRETAIAPNNSLLSSAATAPIPIESPPAVANSSADDATLAESLNAEPAEVKSDTVLEPARENRQDRQELNKFDYVKMSFSGHRNSRTMVKGACFWGDDFIMSGSDCGHIFVWQRQTGKVVKTLLADHRVVNRVQPHPTLPYLVSSGIDYNVKVWAPISPKANFDESETAELIRSNEIMLVETRDTITVPAQIMIRILASLHQYRRLMHASGGSAFGMENRRNRRDAVRVAMNAENAGVVAVAVDRNNDNAANDDIDNENEDNDDSESNHNSNNSNAT
ncbi:DDB1- and CUL4-associated factor 6-like [Drosophila novamexicana]|uniref:DDB1- and CUL4-associated factor 6-like n=1 Tax=Drosophila novamexicana TaxID=47314 RepID=UPI0011E5F05B|nr:DDB1- and CUL4-associated factor 6-like [Drosophila novamexicana]XP_030566070.1 DDB1- and CUL4-associated factor 6-like [Drosophila novamexicana]